MYRDFDNSRIVREFRESNSRSPSPSRPSSRPSSRSRPSSGRLLFPLTDWFDDKVFDWSRADDSDYDDVFFFLDQHNKSKGSSLGVNGVNG